MKAVPDSFEGRLRLFFFLTLVGFCLATFLALFPALERLVEEGVLSHLSAASELLSESWRPETRSFVLDPSEEGEFRVTVIDHQGHVLVETATSAEKMENHAERPEFAQALRGEVSLARRRSQTLDQPLTYLAVPLREGALRVAISTSSVEAALGKVRQVVIAGLLAGALMGFLLVLSLSGWLARPLEALSQAARAGRRPMTHPEWPRELQQLAEALAEMQARIASQLEEQARQRELLESLLEGLEDAVIVMTQGGDVWLSNPSAGSLLETHPTLLQSELAAHSSARGELKTRLHLPLGDRFLTLRSFEVHEFRAVVARDISEFERLDRRRRDFVANASHELRTPLTALGTTLEALDLGAKDDPDQLNSFLTRARNQVERLNRLAQELLDLARAEEGPKPDQSCAPAEVLRRLADTFEFLARNRHQSVRVTTPPEVERVRASMADEELLRALGCVLENALTYSPEGSVVEVTAALEGERLSIQVSDEGPGIPEDQLERVFERFYRVDRGRSRKNGGGTGLGLAIARHLVEVSGGAIRLANRQPTGLVVSITLQTV